MQQALNGNEMLVPCNHSWDDCGRCFYCHEYRDSEPMNIVKTVLEQTMPHNHIERNGIQIKYGETVLVEVDKVSPLLADRQAYHLNLGTLSLEQCEQSQEQLPYFVEMTYSPELLSYHNWRNRIVCQYPQIKIRKQEHAGESVSCAMANAHEIMQAQNSVSYSYRLHRISYNEFAWIKLEPLNIVEFKEQFAGMRKPYDWEQIFGLRVKPECLKAMGMPRDESNMRPITVTQYFEAVGSLTPSNGKEVKYPGDWEMPA